MGVKRGYPTVGYEGRSRRGEEKGGGWSRGLTRTLDEDSLGPEDGLEGRRR